MAATGYTPISLYYSTTAAAVPTNSNLVNGELAINITDGKLYYKDNAGVVKLLASNGTSAPVTTFSAGTTGFTPSTATSGAVTLAGTLNVANGGTGLTSLTAGYIPYGNGTSAFASSSNLYFDGTNLGIGGTASLTSAGITTTRATGVSSGFRLLSGSAWTDLVMNDGSGLNINNTANSVMAFGTNNTERMRITAAGLVGIGTNNPVTQLQVVCNTNADNGIRIQNTSTGSSAYTELWLGSDTNSNAAAIFVPGSGNGSFGGAQSLNLYTGAAYPIAFHTNNSEKMRISATGLVGVGTASATAMLQTAGNSSTAAFKTPNIVEVATVSATAATGTINYDCTTQSVVYYTTNASGNWTINFRGSSGTSLNTIMATGESMSFSFLATQGSTAYYNSAVQVDGTTSGVTTKWQGGSAPTTGNASSIDSYTYVIIKTGSATFTVLATQTKFA